MDTVCDDGHKESPNLINHVHVETAHDSGASALMPAIDSVKEAKKFFYLHYTKKEMRIAKRREYELMDQLKGWY
jgi:hypothetical protein